MTNKTAILFFSRTASNEATVKQFSKINGRNLLVAEALVNDSLRLARRSGLPVFYVNEQQQFGVTFGSRLYNATQSIIARGYEQLIILGNDTPQLRLADIRKAQRGLALGQPVIGKDQRGGAYLIGINAAQCQPELSELPWQSENLAEALTDYLKVQTDENSALPLPQGPDVSICEPTQKVLLLRTLVDVNFAIDLRSVEVFLRKKVSFVFLFFFPKIGAATFLYPFKLDEKLAPPVLRGPPVLG